MKSLLILFVYNREKILKKCLESLFNNTEHRFSEVLFVNDGSSPQLTNNLNAFVLQNYENPETRFSQITFTKNNGYGTVAEFALNFAIIRDPEFLFFVESDYLFAKNGLDKVIDIFENTEFGKNCFGFSGYDNPDFYKDEKVNGDFLKIIYQDCGEDNLNRSIMYKPFLLKTKYGQIDLEFVSNSCGTMYFNWALVSKIREQFPSEFQFWIDKITDKGKSRRLLNDGMMSHGGSWLWNKYAIKNGINRNKFCALLNIKPSIANHVNGGGINGHIVAEGAGFVDSPTWIEAI